MKSDAMHNAHVELDARLAAKCVKAADLAVSAWGLGNQDEAYAAAYRAGELAAKAGASMEQLAKDAPGLLQSGDCWYLAVDGYYDCRDAA